MSVAYAPMGLRALEELLARVRPAAIAVSGGVDSMTLAAVAFAVLDSDVTMFHAVSSAVPPDATARVRRHAMRDGWVLRVTDAHEFEDERYRANPANRCYYCKTNLYDAIAAATDVQVYSGTNTDDLGDYRPGLVAAQEHSVSHPFVSAGIDKQGVRAIATYLGLDDLAELPASPCLSSRIQTGIRIEPEMLSAVHLAERAITDALQPRTVRCRVRRGVVVVELDEATLGSFKGLSGHDKDDLRLQLGGCFAKTSAKGLDIQFEVYKMGSAFVREAAS